MLQVSRDDFDDRFGLILSDKQEDPVVTEDAFQVNNNTFKLVLMENVTWNEALGLCKKNSMDLASVADAHQQAELSVRVSKAGTPLWIGLFSKDVNASCLCTHKQELQLAVT